MLCTKTEGGLHPTALSLAKARSSHCSHFTVTGDDIKRSSMAPRMEKRQSLLLFLGISPCPAMGNSSYLYNLTLLCWQVVLPIKPKETACAAAAPLFSLSSTCTLKPQHLLKINSSGSKRRMKQCHAASPASPLHKVLHRPILTW